MERDRLVRVPLPEPEPELDRIAHAVIGAAIEVHAQMGPGLSEELYEAGLCAEFRRRGIGYAHQVVVPVLYKGEEIGRTRLDLLVEGKVIVELKAVEALAPIHRAQLITYLRITGLKLGLLVNFNVPILKDGVKRVVLT